MRKLVLPLMISLVILCGCADSGEESFMQFMQQVSAANEIGFDALVRAEYSDKTAEFKLGYTQDENGAVVEVKEPELIAGIKARVSEDGTQLEYDGAVLDIGTFAGSELSPMSALPLLAKTMREGHIDIVWTEDDMLVARIIPSDDFTVTLWLSPELEPLNAEITYREKSVVFIEISDWKVS